MLNKIVWKGWAMPKEKNHAWLAMQNRLWTTDRFRRCGWDNCGPCQFCKQTKENHDHLFVHCRFKMKIWDLLKDWLGLRGVFPSHWAGLNIQEWWSSLAEGSRPHRKGWWVRSIENKKLPTHEHKLAKKTLLDGSNGELTLEDQKRGLRSRTNIADGDSMKTHVVDVVVHLTQST
jgi:hypothetical protein